MSCRSDVTFSPPKSNRRYADHPAECCPRPPLPACTINVGLCCVALHDGNEHVSVGATKACLTQTPLLMRCSSSSHHAVRCTRGWRIEPAAAASRMGVRAVVVTTVGGCSAAEPLKLRSSSSTQPQPTAIRTSHREREPCISERGPALLAPLPRS
eukprot:scaffold156046_cov29-Tisochrysis_lutea.AAC.6